MIVDFHGDDDRRASYDFGPLAMPGWHPILAEALALRVGHSGGIRTLSGCRNSWTSAKAWIQFLASLEQPPKTVDELTREHVNAFYTRPGSAKSTRHVQMREMSKQFENERISHLLPADAWDAFNRRLPTLKQSGVGGYSHGELDRLTAAARADVARISRRIRAGEQLLRQAREDPGKLDARQRELGETLIRIAETGEIPLLEGDRYWLRRRADLAGHLFMTWADLAPLMALLAVVTERNGESLKELPVRHRLLEDRAVEVVLVKRRHGVQQWFETVTWEIGPKSRELHTPGGLYLLLLELTGRSREFCGSTAAICFWRNNWAVAERNRSEHFAPFEMDLGRGSGIEMSAWAATRIKPVLADPRPSAKAKAAEDGSEKEPPIPLVVTFNKIKTSMDARRTRQLGGHLPSSAKSNTAQVLFANYLKPDEATREWAEEVITEALGDAEQAALGAHAAVAGRRGGGPKVITDDSSAQQLEVAGLAPQTARDLSDGNLDTAWTACEDHDHNPETGAPCGDSFLVCFHCGNCLVTRDHLPRILALLEALGGLRQRMSEGDWWKRYGPAWVAVRRDILAKFSPAEVSKAQEQSLPDALLDLVEPPWEQP
ncbi:hypothetical protein J7E97_35035 [Streptomyces sp. ISL-66]|uniref:hypothetical protein n=1 Tax=Streptomyces sp. ISL-66 TaxID=2819186 RepID=UPI001BEA19DF|nr:hypothetical protein [Streptomyces sp. ISL-66]MBT2472928.1 hypothetical protein [Streptomyces sp. ISL-66]